MTNLYKFDQPARYHIRINGTLDLRWSDWFDGFTITHINGDTILEGLVSDQAALYGIIAKIRDLGLPLLSITKLDPNG
jgi:hypothetical protein